MLVLRAFKAIAVAAMGLLVSLVAFGNLTDYDTNFAFVQHVLSMDTSFLSSTVRYRAITNPALHHAAYALIIAAEVLTAVLCWIGSFHLLVHVRDTGHGFNRAKRTAIAGLMLGFLLWQVGFIALGGECVVALARSERNRRGPFHRVDCVRWSGAYAAAPAK